MTENKIPNITDEELLLLNDCLSEDDWNNACTKIKGARNGSYPPDWWKKVKLSGLMDAVLARFGETSQMKIGFR
jgi:hypothetical protein